MKTISTLTGVGIFLILTYAFIRLPAWIADSEIAEVIRIGAFGGAVMLCMFVINMLIGVSDSTRKAAYYHNVATELISQHVRYAAQHMFSLHLCENDNFQVVVNVYMPNALINATICVNESEYEIEPFYYFKSDWWDNLEDARLQFVHQRNEL